MGNENLATCRWFKRNLDPPPIVLYECKNKTHLTSSEGIAVTNTLSEAVETLKSLEQLETEFNVLKKMMFKLGAVIRKHKQFQAIQQFSRCIRSLFEMNLYKVYNNIVGIWPKHGASETLPKLPSKQMWQYLLARTHCMVYLLTQACGYGTNALQYSYEKLQLGVFVPSNIVITGCLSRLWAICAVLAGKGVDWYKCLYSWLDKLESSPAGWLESTETLPVSLCSLFARIKQAHTKFRKSELVDSKKRAATDTKSGENVSSKRQKMSIQKKKGKISNQRNEDIGVVVTRTDINTKERKPTHVEKEYRENESPSTFRHMKSVKRWLKRETALRESGAAQASVLLNDRQWAALRKFVKESHDSSVESVSQVIVKWLEKPKLFVKKYRLRARNSERLIGSARQNTKSQKEKNPAKGKSAKMESGTSVAKCLGKRNPQVVDKQSNKSVIQKNSSLTVKGKLNLVKIENIPKKVKKKKKKNRNPVVIVQMQPNSGLSQNHDDIDNIFSVIR